LGPRGGADVEGGAEAEAGALEALATSLGASLGLGESAATGATGTGEDVVTDEDEDDLRCATNAYAPAPPMASTTSIAMAPAKRDEEPPDAPAPNRVWILRTVSSRAASDGPAPLRTQAATSASDAADAIARSASAIARALG
jgi:hypothetical protein